MSQTDRKKGPTWLNVTSKKTASVSQLERVEQRKSGATERWAYTGILHRTLLVSGDFLFWNEKRISLLPVSLNLTLVHFSKCNSCRFCFWGNAHIYLGWLARRFCHLSSGGIFINFSRVLIRTQLKARINNFSFRSRPLTFDRMAEYPTA